MGYHYCQIAGFLNHENAQSSDADLQVWFDTGPLIGQLG